MNAQYPGQVYLTAHSMGNVVAGEALRLAGTNQVVNTYIAMQGAVPAHGYDANAPTRAITPIKGMGWDDNTPNRYAYYYTDTSPCYFASSAGAGRYVNFFNPNDYALSANLWQLDQNLKPDNGLQYPGYLYEVSSLHPNGFYVRYGSGTNDFRNLNFPANTYELFSFCVEARCFALGAQANVGGVFHKSVAYQQVDLSAALYSFGREHKYHSGQFRSDNPSRWQFWNQVLTRMNLNQ